MFSGNVKLSNFLSYGVLALPLVLAGLACSFLEREPPSFGNLNKPPPQKTGTPQKRTVDEIRKDLIQGNLAFNKPKDMLLDESREFKLVVSPTLPVGRLKDLLQNDSEAQTREVPLSDYMEATLYGDNFTIANATQRKLISNSGYTEWVWDVTPTKPGKQRLRLVLNAIVTYDDGEKPLEIETFHELIDVNVSTTQRFTAIATTISGHLQWIVPSLLIPLALWFWNRRGKSKAEDQAIEQSAEIESVAPEKKKESRRKKKRSVDTT